MRALLADHDVEGHLARLIDLLHEEEFRDLWLHLGIEAWYFDDVGLSRSSSDREVWEFCQSQECVLITGNRNMATADSLEQVLRDRATPTSLPVLTIANVERFRTDRTHREAVAWRLLDYLVDIDEYAGTPRLYLP